MPSGYSNDFPMLINGIKCYSLVDHDQLEAVHKEALLAAKIHHERVREEALLVLLNNRLQEEQDQLLEIKRQEEKRLKLEQEKAELATQVAELQRRKIEATVAPKIEHVKTDPPCPRVKPSATTKPTAPEPPAQDLFEKELEAELEAELEKEPTKEKTQEELDAELEAFFDKTPSPPTAEQIARFQGIDHALLTAEAQRPARSQVKSSQGGAPQSVPSPPVVPQQRNEPQTARKAVVPPVIAAPVAKPIDTSHLVPGAQQYLEIHRRLKELRRFMVESAKQNPELKKKMGEGRREIRKSVGQLTEGKAGTNRVPLNKIMDVLNNALIVTPSPLIDPGMVMLKRPNASPDPATPNNGDQLPGLFIYLLNQFSKSVINQLLDEAGSKTKAANPIGVIVANVFAKVEHRWRGAPLIDILMAKFRVVCPVLFGVRGNEKTEKGRARLGWKKENGEWISEQSHMFRMIGLGAGYAAIALRDFSKSKMENPYPPTNYWMSMASIVGTPLAETSPTQYTVLKAMINNFEQRFLDSYGHAGLAALQLALVNFPAQQQGRVSAANALMVHGEKLKRDGGLPFVFPQGW